MPRRGTVQRPDYFRPELNKFENEQRALDYIKQAGTTKLDSNMWLIGVTKSWLGGYRSHVVIKSGNKYFMTEFPTDKKGTIPLEVMAQRIMDVADGDRKGQQRNMFVDLAITAENNNEPKDLAKSYVWYLYPNEGDIKAIDDANSKLVTILPSSIQGKRRSLLIMGGTKKQRDAVAGAIDRAFTLKEKQILAGCLIQIKSAGRGAAGWYMSARYAGKGGAYSIITIGPEFATEDKATVTVHEAVHAIRDLDESRLPELRRQGRIQTGRDSDFEESLTEAEGVGREKPLTGHVFPGGYYPFLREDVRKGRSKEQVVIDDRKIITQPKNPDEWLASGRKGKKVQKLLKEHYPTTVISKLKIKGGVEAIDTFYGLKNRNGETVNVQVFSPKGNAPTIEKGDLQTVEYRDGKTVVTAGNQIPISGRKQAISRGVRISPRTPRLRR